MTTGSGLLKHFINDCQNALCADARWRNGHYSIVSGIQSVNEHNMDCSLSACQYADSNEASKQRLFAVVPLSINLASGDGGAFLIKLDDPIAHSIGRVSLIGDKIKTIDNKDDGNYEKAIGLVKAYMLTAISDPANQT